MIQIIEENRRPRKPKFSERLLSGGANLASEASREIPNLLMRREEERALKERGIDLKGIHSPSVRSAIIAEGLKRGTAFKHGEASVPEHLRQGKPSLEGAQKTTEKLAGIRENVTQADAIRKISTARKETPSLGGQRAILTPEQQEQEAANRLYQKQSQGLPTSFQDEMAELRQQQSDIARYKQYQEQVAAKSDEALGKVFPEATDEHKSILRKKAEEFAQQNLSSAEMDRKLAIEARNFKNKIASVKNSLPAKRAWNRLSQGILGKGRDAEKARDSIRLKLKPFLDEGLYDTARNLLADRGYAPEERESIISNLGELTKKNLASLPDVKPLASKFFRGYDPENVTYRAFKNNPEGQRAFTDNMKEVLKSDPAANLILLRKAYEDKGIDWSSFKDSLDELMINGDFNPNEDQNYAINLLDEPPLDRLDKLFFNLNLQGR